MPISIDLFPMVKVLVIGDPIQDVYHFGRVDRLSPEAPVPIFIEERVETRRGGADNVAANLEALGCQVSTAFGQVSVKHRYLVGSHQLFRIDADASGGWGVSVDAGFAEPDVIVLSDYNKGTLTPAVCQAAIKSGKLVIVDPKGTDWSKYAGAKVICPNHKELEAVTLNPGFEHVLEKRGAEGMRLNGLHIPAVAKQVFDVTGAGDTVVACLAAAMGSGATLIDAVKLANYAAGVVVGKIGTATCSAAELRSV